MPLVREPYNTWISYTSTRFEPTTGPGKPQGSKLFLLNCSCPERDLAYFILFSGHSLDINKIILSYLDAPTSV